MRWRTHTLAALLGAGVLESPGAEPKSVHTVAQQDPWWSPSGAASASVSGDGRYVAFTSYAQLVAADTNVRRDVYVLDRTDGRVTLESVGENGQAALADSDHPRISADGRFVVYETAGPGTDQDLLRIVLRDRRLGRLTQIGGDRGGGQDGISMHPAVSADGAVVVFASASTTLVHGRDANGAGLDIYAFEAARGVLRRVSVDASGVQDAAGTSSAPAISADGRYVAFVSTANLEPGKEPAPARGISQIYVKDLSSGATMRASATRTGAPANGRCWAPAISADARYVTFVSGATNLAAGDSNRLPDVFLAELAAGGVELLSRGPGGSAVRGASGAPAISADGAVVAFQSEAADVLCAARCAAAAEDINLLWDVFLLDRRTGVTTRVSGDARGAWMEPSGGPAIDAAGDLVVFSSRHPVDESDTGNDADLFLIRPAIRRAGLPLAWRAPARLRPWPSGPCPSPSRCSA